MFWCCCYGFFVGGVIQIQELDVYVAANTSQDCCRSGPSGVSIWSRLGESGCGGVSALVLIDHLQSSSESEESVSAGAVAMVNSL